MTIPKDDTKLLEFLTAVFQDMKEARKDAEAEWKEITDYLYPRRANPTWGNTTGRLLETDAGSRIFDGESIAALNRLSHGLFGWLVSPSIDWLMFVAKDIRDRNRKDVRKYCQEVRDHLLDVFARSNFYETMAEDMTDGCALGTSVVFVDDDPDAGLPVYTPLHIREVYLSENHRGQADVLFRDMDMTCRQFLLEYADEAKKVLDAKVIENLEKNPEARVRVLHCMYPTGMNGILKTAMPYASVHIVSPDTTSGIFATRSMQVPRCIIRKGGMSLQKFRAWRFRKYSGQVYGGCPAMDAKYDIKMINISSKAMSDTEQLASRPPMQAPETMRGRVKIHPGSMTYHDGELVTRIDTGVQPAFGLDAMQRRARIIREHFFSDYFMATSSIQQGSRERTREEILQMKAESAAVLGSVVGRIQSERLEPMVYLTMAIEKEAGRLPEPPDGMDDIEFQIKFTGPLARAQRQYIKTNALNQGLSLASGFAQLFGPTVLFNINEGAAMREALDSMDFPTDNMRDPAEVAKMTQQYQEAQAAAQAAAAQNEALAAMGRGARSAEPGSPTARAMGRE